MCNAIITGVGEPEVELGKNLRINLNLNKPENAQNDVTYLVTFYTCACVHFEHACCFPQTCAVYVENMLIFKSLSLPRSRAKVN